MIDTPPPGTTTSFDAAHDAIVDALREHFGSRVRQVGGYSPLDPLTDEPQSALQVPALLVRIAAATQDDEGDPDPVGRLVFRAECEVRCVLSIESQDLGRDLIDLATQVAALVLPRRRGDQRRRGNRWGLGAAAESPLAVSVEEDFEFPQGLHGRAAYLVRWEQIFYLDGELTA